jgi:LysM repeat protein
MNKMFTIIGGSLLTTALVVVLVLANIPQSTELTPTDMPTLLPTDVSTLTPVVTETSIPPFTYIVESGDTCAFIAINFNVSVEAIIDINNLSPLCILESGQMLLIPYPSTSPLQSNEVPNTLPTEPNSIPTEPNSSYSFPSASSNPSVEFFDEWINVDSQTDNITRISIQANDGETYINMFGACLPTDCNFREIPSASVNYNYDSETEILHTEWIMDFVIMTQELTMTSDEQLKVKTHNHFVDNSGRLDFDETDYFTRQ